MRVVRNQHDFAVGVGYIVAGALFALVARSYEMGTTSQMGPGYFPFWLGVLLIVLGSAVMLRAADKRVEASVLERWDGRSLVWIAGSVVLFGLTLRGLGLILSLGLLVVLSSLVGHEFTWKGTLINTAVLVGINVGIFVYALGLPLPVWPAFIGP